MSEAKLLRKILAWVGSPTTSVCAALVPCLAVFLAMNCCQELQGQSLGCPAAIFANPAGYSTGTDPRALTACDFNGDGNPDVAAVNRGSRSVAVLLGNGTGALGLPISFSTPFDAPDSITTADFDHDGHEDIVVASRAADALAIFLGDGAGGFSLSTTLSALGHPASVDVADFDRDRNMDIAVACESSGSIVVMLGDGVGGIASLNPVLTGATRSVVTGDFNEDGLADIVATRFSTGIVALLGDGTGNFAPARVSLPSMAVLCLTSVDMNGDGMLDLAATRAMPASVMILHGDGTGRFEVACTQAGAAGGVGSIVAAELNGDHFPDVILSDAYGNFRSTVMLGSSGPHLSPPTSHFLGTASFSAPSSGNSVGCVDLDHDGREDLIAVNSGSGDVCVLLNTCTPEGPLISFVPPTPVGSPQSVQVGQTLTFTVAAAMTPGFEGFVRLESITLPAGASHDPPLPIGSASLAQTTFAWTPTAAQAGNHVASYLATDGRGTTVTVSVSITVTSSPGGCLLIGTSPTNTPVVGNDVLLVDADIMHYIPPDTWSIPFWLPPASALSGFTVYAQVLMFIPTMPTQDPLLTSNGLEVIFGSGANVYGTGSGAALWMSETPALGSWVNFSFAPVE